MKRTILYVIASLLLLSVVSATPSSLTLYSQDGKALTMDNMAVTMTAGLTQISGVVTDALTGVPVSQGSQIIFTCTDQGIDKNTVTALTNAEGNFAKSSMSILPEMRCAYGYDAVMKVIVEGKEYTSLSFLLEKNVNHKKSTTFSAADASMPAVPEFNTITLGLAVIGGGLALVLIRKR